MKGDGEVAPLWDGVKPQTPQAWIALGKEVFFAYPLRAEPLVEFAVAHPQLAEAVGLERTAEGAYVGPVKGHAFGTDWPQEDRTAVIAWMRTL